MAKCLLFAYGLLKPGIQPPKSMTNHWPDRIVGRLFDLGPYPGAIDIGLAATTFQGEVLEIEDEELGPLDLFEGVDVGLYIRRRARTEGGRDVWIYEYAKPVLSSARPIRSWPPEHIES